jgi:hypothetical protein
MNRPSLPDSGVFLNEFLRRLEHLLGASDSLLSNAGRYSHDAFRT